MATGFKSAHPILGIGVPHSAARGYGPLPFMVGVPAATTTVGRGHGPLPFMLGVLESTAPITPTGPSGGGAFLPYRIERRNLDDEDLMDLLIILASAGVFN